MKKSALIIIGFILLGCGLLVGITLWRSVPAVNRQIMILLTPEPHFFEELYLINADGTNQIQLTNNLMTEVRYSWSPDGQQIVFAGSHQFSKYQIFVLNMKDRRLLNLTQNLEAGDRSPTWAPDSKQIAYVSDQDGNLEIYRINADGTERTRLTYTAEKDENPVWSPDGRRLAFTSTRDGNREIYVMNVDGSQQTRLTYNNVDRDWQPAWSPDGKRLAFASDRDGDVEIYVMNIDGSQQTNITNAPRTWEKQPRWSPDGQLVGFRADRFAEDAIYVADASGQERLSLHDYPAFRAAPVWSPDGKQIAIEVIENIDIAHIHLINVDGTGEIRLNLTQVPYAVGPVWSPDGKQLLFSGDPADKD